MHFQIWSFTYIAGYLSCRITDIEGFLTIYGHSGNTAWLRCMIWLYFSTPFKLHSFSPVFLLFLVQFLLLRDCAVHITDDLGIKTKTKRRYHYVTVHYNAKTLTASIPIDDEEFETKPTEQTSPIRKQMCWVSLSQIHWEEPTKCVQYENPINYDWEIIQNYLEDLESICNSRKVLNEVYYFPKE